MDILVIVNQNFHGLYTPIIEALKKKGHNARLLELGKVARFRYNFPLQRLVNGLSKAFLRRNRKQEWRDIQIATCLSHIADQRRNNSYDLIIVNHTDTCNKAHIGQLKSMSKTLGAHLWDSRGKEPQFFENIDEYDTVISFDPIDAELYSFADTTNYIAKTVLPLKQPEHYDHDVFAVMSYDKSRYKFIELLIDNNPQVDFDIVIYVQSEHRRKHVTHPKVTVIEQPLLGDELLARIAGSKAILDIGHKQQHGLSFRVMEALGYERKLITTNKKVIYYPFYQPQNIFCIDDDQLAIEHKFFQMPYLPIEKTIVSRYRLNNWIDDYLAKLTHGSPHRG